MILTKGIWVWDFEYRTDENFLPIPVCMCAKELLTGKVIKLWLEGTPTSCPDFVTTDAIYTAYNASAELGCHKVLGWPFPSKILDLYIEYRNITNGKTPPKTPKKLLNALEWFGTDGMAAIEKKSFQDRILKGPPYSDEEKVAILDYCLEDVVATEKLLSRMLPKINLGQALIRGKYMQAVAEMFHTGIPLDITLKNRLSLYWDQMKLQLIAELDEGFGVYEGTTFKISRWANRLKERNIPWPTTPCGHPKTDEETFQDMVKVYPEIRPIHELRYMISKLKLKNLSIGADGCNRTWLNPFGSLSGRNQPSTASFIFGPASWMRSLIKPPKGKFVAYIDYSQQEFGIAASFSGCPNMLKAYLSGDPYLEFAKQAGAVPSNATKETHQKERDLYKMCILGQQYGMGAESLARNIGEIPHKAQRLIREHKTTFRRYWQWITGRVDNATLTGSMGSIFGWRYHLDSNFKVRTLQNFPMQANGAEMLRLAIIYALDRGVEVIAPVHDAILIMGDIEKKDHTIQTALEAMYDASTDILGNLTLRCDVEIVEYPNRYIDKRGEDVFAKVMRILEEVEARECARSDVS